MSAAVASFVIFRNSKSNSNVIYNNRRFRQNEILSTPKNKNPNDTKIVVEIQALINTLEYPPRNICRLLLQMDFLLRIFQAFDISN